MSIIVEALKKAQGSVKTAPPSRREDSLPPPPPQRQIRKPKIKKHITIWVIGSFLFLAGILFYFLSRNLIKEDLSVSPQAPPPASPLTDNSAALKEEVERPSYVLSPIEETPPTISPLPIIPSPPPAPVISPPPVASSPSLTIAEVKKSIDLNGIMYTPEKPLAVINGAVWGVEDDIGRFRILEIEKDFIRVTAEGQEFIIKLKR